MNQENHDILIYKYTYQELGLDLEGEFFLSFMRTLQPPGSKKPPIKFYMERCIYSEPQFHKILSRYKDFIYWSDREISYKFNSDIGSKWMSLAKMNDHPKFIRIPPWLIQLAKDFKLNFTDMMILADIYSFQNKRLEYHKCRASIAEFLDLHIDRISKKLTRLKDLGLIEIIKTKTVNIMKLTAKFLSYDTGREG